VAVASSLCNDYFFFFAAFFAGFFAAAFFAAMKTPPPFDVKMLIDMCLVYQSLSNE
jgi:hypothetical protein